MTVALWLAFVMGYHNIVEAADPGRASCMRDRIVEKAIRSGRL